MENTTAANFFMGRAVNKCTIERLLFPFPCVEFSGSFLSCGERSKYIVKIGDVTSLFALYCWDWSCVCRSCREESGGV
eukprot:9845478-Ditylum_brightwellii.AAC.1